MLPSSGNSAGAAVLGLAKEGVRTLDTAAAELRPLLKGMTNAAVAAAVWLADTAGGTLADAAAKVRPLLKGFGNSAGAAVLGLSKEGVHTLDTAAAELRPLLKGMTNAAVAAAVQLAADPDSGYSLAQAATLYARLSNTGVAVAVRLSSAEGGKPLEHYVIPLRGLGDRVVRIAVEIAAASRKCPRAVPTVTSCQLSAPC